MYYLYHINCIWCIKYHKLSIHIYTYIHTSYQFHLIYIHIMCITHLSPTTSSPTSPTNHPELQLSTASHSPPRPRRLSDASSALESHEAEAEVVESHPLFWSQCPFPPRILGFWRISIWMFPNTPKWSFLVGKPMVVGYHHSRKHPYVVCWFVLIFLGRWVFKNKMHTLEGRSFWNISGRSFLYNN